MNEPFDIAHRPPSGEREAETVRIHDENERLQDEVARLREENEKLTVKLEDAVFPPKPGPLDLWIALYWSADCECWMSFCAERSRKPAEETCRHQEKQGVVTRLVHIKETA